MAKALRIENPSLAKAVGQKITEQAGLAQNYLQQMENINTTIQQNWRGPDADSYIRKFTELAEQMKKFTQTISTAGELVTQAVNTIEQYAQNNVIQ